MPALEAKARNLALAGIGALSLVAGGALYLRSSAAGASPHTVARGPLAGRAPGWADPYRHFVLTVAHPLSVPEPSSQASGRHLGSHELAAHPSAGAGTPFSAHPGHEGAGAGQAFPAGKGTAGQGTAGQGTVSKGTAGKGTVSKGTAGKGTVSKGTASQGTVSKGTASQGTAGGRAAATVAKPGQTGVRLGAVPSSAIDGGTWEAVAPNAADPIVLRPGEPISLLAQRLAAFPQGTTLERDRNGDLRAVLPPGAKAPSVPTSAPPPARPGPAGRGTSRSARVATLPPGWQPDSRAVVSSLLKVPGIVSAQPVWGSKYQIATTLTESQVRSLPGVSAVVTNRLLHFTSASQPNDPELAQEYYVANSGQTVESQAGTPGASADFAAAWGRSTGTGVVIADIDTGVDLQNPDLSGQILATSENFSVSPPNSNVQAQGTANGFYHATTVDGVMVAQANNNYQGVGAAPGAKVLALKCGDSESLSDSCIYAAGEYAIAQHVNIINMSFGEATGSDPLMASLVANAQAAGILVTASAGNSGTNNDASAVLPAGLATTYANVISVGATDNQDNLASFSDYGATTVDLMAPGTAMYTDYPAYTGFPAAYVSGTSYAAPMVAAAAALLWSADPALSYAQVKADILSTAQPVPALAGKCVTGARLDAQAALALALGSAPPPSSTTTTAPTTTTTTTVPKTTTTTTVPKTTTTVPKPTTTTTTVPKPTTTTTVPKTTATTTAPKTTTTLPKPTATTTTVPKATTTLPKPTTTTTTLPKPTTTTTTVPKPTTTTTTVPKTTTTLPKPTTTTVLKPTTTSRALTAAPTTAALGGRPGSVVRSQAPDIDTVAPNELPASGGDVSIFGAGFPANPVVKVGNVNVAVSYASATEIDLMVGALAPGRYRLTVYNDRQTEAVSVANGLTVDPAFG